MTNSLLARLPKRDEILPVFAVAAFIFFGRSLYIFFFKLPSWSMFMTVWEILSVLAYGLVFSLFESLLMQLFLLFICLILPVKWLRNNFVSQGTWFLLAMLLSILLYFMRYSSKGPDYLSVLPLWSLITLGMAALFTFLGGRVRFLRVAAVWFSDRLIVFLYLFIPASLVSLVVIFFRNIL